MQRALETLNNQNLAQLVPLLQAQTDNYTNEMAIQRAENQKLQQSMTEMKKDKAMMEY